MSIVTLKTNFIMSKDTSYYFSHDYNCRQDIKIKKLLVKHGMIGYGCFWSIIEDLYNNANALPLDYESIAYDLRVAENVIDSIINDFELFVIEGSEFGSKSVEKRLEERNEKSTKARQSALKRWGDKNNDANAFQTESEPNAINEKKVKEKKESKGNESEIIDLAENEFSQPQKVKTFKQWTLEDFQNSIKNENKTSLQRSDLIAFYNHWIEKTPAGKFKFQLEKTWQTNLRLTKWEANKQNFNKFTAKPDPKIQQQNAFITAFDNLQNT